PRIRTDLTAVAVDEEWCDVTDPSTGQVHRLAASDWRVAQRMDGATDIDTLSREELVDAAELADQLRELGLLEKAQRKGIAGGWSAPTGDQKVSAKANLDQAAVTKEPDADVEEMKKFFRKAPDEEAFARMRRKRATVSSGVLTGIGMVAVTAALPVLVYL